MSNGGPHGDKWNKYPVQSTTTSDNLLTLLNTLVEGKYASSAFVADTTDGKFIYIANYGTP